MLLRGNAKVGSSVKQQITFLFRPLRPVMRYRFLMDSQTTILEPRYGIHLELPDGVSHRKFQSGYVFGHPALHGLMLMLYHRNKTLEELKTDIYAGFFDDTGFNIQVDGLVRDIREDMVMADYKGLAENRPARGFAIGMLSPWGGGALLAAITSEDNFTEAHKDLVEDLATGIRFEEPAFESGEDEWIDFLRGQQIVKMKPAGIPGEMTGLLFDEKDAFKARFSDTDATASFENFETGGANRGGQWTVREMNEEYFLHLIFFSGDEKHFHLRFSEDHLLLNDDSWRIEGQTHG